MKNENFVSQEVMEIDSDGGQTMEAVLEIAKRTEIYPVEIYPTFSHDPEAGKHKFRMIFKLPFPVADRRLRRAVMHSLLKLFKIEVGRYDYSPSAIYQGTNKTLFFDKLNAVLDIEYLIKATVEDIRTRQPKHAGKNIRNFTKELQINTINDLPMTMIMCLKEV